jgi:site-specific recombinase XerD
MARSSRQKNRTHPVPVLTVSFLRHLRAENASPNTIMSYRDSIKQFVQFLSEQNLPVTAGEIEKKHVELFIEDLLSKRAPATAHNRYRGVRQFFKWALEEGEIKTSPMTGMSPPRLPETLVPVLSEKNLEALLNACSGSSFDDRRDMALISMFISTGARKSEISELRYGKGDRDRIADLTPRSVRALDRYLRIRSSHRDADLPWLWLGKQGLLSSGGCAKAVQRRAEAAGLGKIHLHQLRHTYAHFWMLDGGGEDSLMRNMGWKTREMLSRYAASAGTERALAANRKVGLGARF